MKTFETTFESRDGIKFYARGWEPDGSPKALIALLHGLGEHSGRYTHVADVLTGAGYILAGFDLRGHGKSSGARGHFPSLDAVMQDIRRFFGFLSERYPTFSPFLYGHSLGGLLALTYTLQYEENLKGVIVTGAGLRSALQEQKAKVMLAKAMGSLFPTVTIPSGLEVDGLSRDPNVVAAYLGDPLVHDKATLGLGKSALNAIDLCFARAREFRPPLLIMHGKADRITYASGSEEFARRASETNKDVTLKLWDGLYHELHNEPEKAEVFKVMIEWLEKHI
ncbi:MAG TPA: lysophospholipase [Anaerolineales bacterium]|nr:lysophospholipase [Anaerolineales bacterium]